MDLVGRLVVSRNGLTEVNKALQELENSQKNLDPNENINDKLKEIKHDYEILGAWKRVCEFHLEKLKGNCGNDNLIDFYDNFFQVRKPVIATKLHNGKEYQFLGDPTSGDHYIFEKCLGRNGGAGDKRCIWKCTEILRNGGGFNNCVIKAVEINSTFLNRDPLFYKREFIAHEIAGSMKHPNILSLWQYYGNENMGYALMAAGDDCLFDQLCLQYQYAQRGFDESVIRHLFRQMVSAIEFITRIGILHRDISLENFVVYGSLKVELLDFGLAIPLELDDQDSGTWKPVKSTVVGKINYMSPQIFHAQNQKTLDGVAADLWSLGVCLFMLLSGRSPYRCAGMACELFQHLAQKGPIFLLKQLVSAGKVNQNVAATKKLLDCMTGLLQVDVEQRLTLDQLVNHPFTQSKKKK